MLRLPLVLEFNSSEVWKGRYWGGLRLARAAAIVERINLRAADRVVVVSRVLRDALLPTGVPAAKILVNPNGVDPAQFRPDVDGTRCDTRLGVELRSRRRVFGHVRRVAWHSRRWPRRSPQVCEARPNVRWLLIGDGPLRPLVDEAVATA